MHFPSSDSISFHLNEHFDEILAILYLGIPHWVVGTAPYIKPDMPINVYAWFCLSTAKSKFSPVSPVAD